MTRRDFVLISMPCGAVAALAACQSGGRSAATAAGHSEAGSAPGTVLNPLTPPRSGQIPVAFLISEGTVEIDLVGPWEVFQRVTLPSRGRTMEDQIPFRLYTVAENMTTLKTAGGLKITPDYTFANAPAPKVIVIPAQNGSTKALLEWIRSASRQADVTMSVCTGSFLLAKAGLLSGKAATTHHGAYKELALQFPDIQVKRGLRFVEAGNVATAGGLSSGIDLALRVVERYFGHQAAADTAYMMEYQGRGWMDPTTNAIYAQAAVSTDEHPLCPVCEMEVDRATAPTSVYEGKTYYFCSGAHKAAFDKAPEKWR